MVYTFNAKGWFRNTSVLVSAGTRCRSRLAISRASAGGTLVRIGLIRTHRETLRRFPQPLVSSLPPGLSRRCECQKATQPNLRSRRSNRVHWSSPRRGAADGPTSATRAGGGADILTPPARIDRLQRRYEVVRQREGGRRLHTHCARHVGHEVVAVVGENAPGMAGGADMGDDRVEPAILGGGEWPTEAACDLVAESVLFRNGRRVHREEMSEHHTG